MKGITPVIAIILLLLMAVAAAGGFYIVYQNFASSGEESGSSQIDALGEQTLSQIKIESAAGGRIYIRNTGATDIDASKLSVFVENVPVEVNSSSDTLAENSRATLKLTQVPTCTSERCEVKVSGAASTTQTIDLAKLLCSTDADCLQSESCEGGLCISSGEDSEFSSIISFIVDVVVEGSGITDSDTYSFFWNGSTYEQDQAMVINPSLRMDDGQTCMVDDYDAMMVTGWNDSSHYVNFSRYDGTSWSDFSPFPEIEEEDHDLEMIVCKDSGEYTLFWMEGSQARSCVFSGGSWAELENITESVDSGGSYVHDLHGVYASTYTMAIFSMKTEPGSDNKTIMYSKFSGGSWSEPQNVSEEETDWLTCDPNVPVVGMNGDNEGFAVWETTCDDSALIRSSFWDGSSWGTPVQIAEYGVDMGQVQPLRAGYTQEGEPFVVLNAIYSINGGGTFGEYYLSDAQLQFSKYSGGSWTAPENVTITEGRKYSPVLFKPPSTVLNTGGSVIQHSDGSLLFVGGGIEGELIGYFPLAWDGSEFAVGETILTIEP